MEKKLNDKFFKVMLVEESSEATILLYGFIGEEYSYDEDSQRWRMTGVTDSDFVKELNRLSESYKVINIRLNSPGGDFFHGNAIMTAIQNSKAEIHTWNDGIAASMAADIWLCGHKRHMAKNALLMIHPAWSWAVGHAQDMRDCAEQLEKITDAAIIATASSLGMSEDEMRSRYYADYKDRWLSYNDAVADKLVTETSDEYDAANMPEKIDDMTYKQLLSHFQKNDDAATAGVLENIKRSVSEYWNKITRKSAALVVTQPSLTNPIDMTIDDFRKSLADGTLSHEEVEAHLEEIKKAATPASPPPATVPDEVQKKLDDQSAAIALLQAELKKLAEMPGAAKSVPTPPTEVAAPVTNPELDDFNKSLKTLAENDQNPRFVPGIKL